MVEAVSGYIGGIDPDPTYQEVSAGGTGHAEAVQLRYDPEVVSYEQLLEVYWRQCRLPGRGRPVLRPRRPVPLGDLRPRRGAEAGGAPDRKAKLEEEGAGFRTAPSLRRSIEAGTFPSRRGVSPGLLQEESDPLQILPLHTGGRDQRLAELWQGHEASRVALRAGAHRLSPPGDRGRMVPGSGRRSSRSASGGSCFLAWCGWAAGEACA